ncbi:MAG: hypothetical protein ACJLTB_22120 [Algoriphagus aquaeductus]|uniref:hypothetical protein n=1 Tax=Algoriphagus aquaeductus TaxID=475299 RepID=UPI00387A22C7
MNDSKKTSAEFRVLSSFESGKPYFLWDFPGVDCVQELEYQWHKKGKLKAVVRVAIQKDGKAVSSPGLPFGGIWIFGSIHTDELTQFVDRFVLDLKNRGLSSLFLTQPPKPYEPFTDLIQSVLFKKGFVQTSVLSHQFFLGKKKIKEEAQNLKEKLKSQKNDLRLTSYRGQIMNFKFLQEIRNWNNERGYAFNLDEKRVIEQVSVFPERYFQISIFKNDHPIAHAMAVKLVPEGMYYFLSAISPSAKVPNCGDLILLNLFQLAAEQKSEFIDLGSSEIESGINHGLMFFKSRFSNDISNKVTWNLRF